MVAHRTPAPPYALVLGVAGLTCTTSPPPDTPGPPATEPNAAVAPPSPAQVKADPHGCRSAEHTTPERIELGANSVVSTASGLEVHFVGTSTDHYEDGGFDILAEFQFRWGTQTTGEIVSALAPTDQAEFRPALGHCWRLLDAHEESASVEVGPADSSAARLPSCAAISPAQGHRSLVVFDSYYHAAKGSKYIATLRYDASAHEWLVEPQPELVMHHATRLEWTNLVDWGRRGLGRARNEDVRVVFRFDDSKIERVPGRHEWRSEHFATIEVACLP